MIDELVALVGVPAEPVHPANGQSWEIVETELGVELPEDYKEIVSTFGSGIFGGYIILYNPFVPNFSYRGRAEWLHQLFLPGQQAFPEDHAPFKLYPDKDGLLPIGMDDNGGLICYEPWESSPGRRIILIDEEFDSYDVFEGTLVELLLAWLKRDYAPRQFPEDTPAEDEPLFRSKMYTMSTANRK